MKKVVCYLLIVWLALVSGGASASIATNMAHEATYTHDHTSHMAHTEAAVFEAVEVTGTEDADSNHADSCSQTHCGHGHTTGLLAFSGTPVWASGLSAVLASRASWANSPKIATIERPKWRLTTPAVVSLLS